MIGCAKMYNDYEPIHYNTPKDFDEIEIYLASDLHYGNPQFNENKWNAFKSEILSQKNRYLIFAGDAMENAVPGSKSSVFEQIKPPFEQREWIVEEFKQLKDRILAVVDGNHERNRSTKLVGLYPLYDACLLSDIGHLYRPHFAFVDIGVGSRKKDPKHQTHYVAYVTHRAKETRLYSSADFIDGIDLMVYGHDHSSHDSPRGKLVYDKFNKLVSQATVEVLDSGSFLKYGGYAVDSAFRPNPEKMYKVTLLGKEKKIITTGFYL